MSFHSHYGSAHPPTHPTRTHARTQARRHARKRARARAHTHTHTHSTCAPYPDRRNLLEAPLTYGRQAAESPGEAEGGRGRQDTLPVLSPSVSRASRPPFPRLPRPPSAPADLREREPIGALLARLLPHTHTHPLSHTHNHCPDPRAPQPPPFVLTLPETCWVPSCTETMEVWHACEGVVGGRQ